MHNGKKVLITRTYNRREDIKRILDKCLYYFDKYIVVDSGSSDGTEELCSKYSKVVFVKAIWEDRKRSMLVDLFQYGLDLCDFGDYILSLDSDEVPEEEFMINMDEIIYEMESTGCDRAKLFSIACIDGYFDENHRITNLELINDVNLNEHCLPFGRTMFFKHNPETVFADVDSGVHGQFLFKENGKTLNLPYFFYHFKTSQTLCESCVYSYAEWGQEYCKEANTDDIDTYWQLASKYNFNNFRDLFLYLKIGGISDEWKEFINKGASKKLKGHFYDFLQSLYALYFCFLHPEESPKDISYFKDYDGIGGDRKNTVPFYYPERIEKAKLKNVYSETEGKVKEILGVDTNDKQIFIQIEEEWDSFIDFIADKNIKIENALEIGSYYGAGLMALNYLTEKGGQIISVDNNGYGVFKSASQQSYFFRNLIDKDKDFLSICINSTLDDCYNIVKSCLGNDKLDMLFIDGSHEYKDVRVDFEKYSRLVKDDGIIAFHDIAGKDTPGVVKYWKEIKYRYSNVKEFVSLDFPTGIGVIQNRLEKKEFEFKNVDLSRICICCCNAVYPNNDIIIENFLYHYCNNLNSITRSIPLYICCDKYDDKYKKYDMFNEKFINICNNISEFYGMDIRVRNNQCEEGHGHYRMVDDFIYREIYGEFDWVILIDFDLYIQDQTWINDYIKILDENPDISVFGDLHGDYYDENIQSYVAHKFSTQLLGVNVEDFVEIGSSLRGLGCDGFDWKEKQIGSQGKKLFCDSATFYLFDLLKNNKKIYFSDYYDENPKFKHLGAVTNKCNPDSVHYDANLTKSLRDINFFSKFDKSIRRLGFQSSDNLEIGAFYYIWYGKDDPSWKNLVARSKLTQKQEPYLGHYGSLDDYVISKHIDWANSAGIDFFIVCIDKDLLESGKAKTFLDKYSRICSSKKSFPKISIQIELLSFFKDPMLFSEGDIEKITSILKKYGDLYREDLWYKIDGKPSVFFYVARQIQSGIEIFIDSVRETLGENIHLSGDICWHNLSKDDLIGSFDSIYAYNLYVHNIKVGDFDNREKLKGLDFTRKSMEAYRNYEEISKRLNKKMIPSVFPRYNDRGVRIDIDHYVIPEDNGSSFFRGQLKNVSRFLSDGILLVTSFNEWYEDTQIEPCGRPDEYGQICNEPESITEGHQHYVYYKDFLKIIREFKDSFKKPTNAAPSLGWRAKKDDGDGEESLSATAVEAQPTLSDIFG